METKYYGLSSLKSMHINYATQLSLFPVFDEFNHVFIVLIKDTLCIVVVHKYNLTIFCVLC